MSYFVISLNNAFEIAKLIMTNYKIIKDFYEYIKSLTLS